MKTWDLSNLYRSFESDLFLSDYNKLNSTIDISYNFIEENLKNYNEKEIKLEKIIENYSKSEFLYKKLSSYCNLVFSKDVNNKHAPIYLEKINTIYIKLNISKVKFRNWLQGFSNLDQIINSNAFLKEHSFFIREELEKSYYNLSEKEEELILNIKNSSSNAWSNLQKKLVSKLLVPININGKNYKKTLSDIKALYTHSDKNIRKTAYEAELKAYELIDESIVFALNGIKGEAITISKLKGFSSPLEETLLKSRVEKETLDIMLEEVKEFLPEIKRFYKKKAELLGHENGLPFYDILANIGDSNINYSYEEAMEYIISNFKNFSNELSNFARKAYEESWIDVEPIEGKRGGAFCMNIPPIKESRILTNFKGSFANMKTLAHELGHAYHGHCLREEEILNTNYTMPIAETASIFCETLIVDNAIKNANKETKINILNLVISSYGTLIADIMSRFIFESEVFKRREKSSLSLSEIKSIMKSAQKEAYLDALDPDFLHEYAWLNKPHYYYPERHFYNFPYTFGLLISKGIYYKYQSQEDGFIEKYNQLLKSSGKMKIKDLLKTLDIDINQRSFWKNSLEIIKRDIDEFIKLTS